MAEETLPKYPVLHLSMSPQSGTGEGLQGLGQEPLGSKRKLWGLLESEPDCPWLFKFARAGTGEHWAEKIAAELAGLLDLPAARVELATLDAQPGAIVRSILPYDRETGSDFPIRRGELVHGNEILAGRLPGYDKDRQWRQENHSWENIVEALKESLPPEEWEDSFRRLAGMIVLDAWIGNTDRHHENWAILISADGRKRLSPSYDHASSLGREFRDKKRAELLRQNRIPDYVQKGWGAIYGQAMGRHADNPLDLVTWAAGRNPDWFVPWISRLRAMKLESIPNLLQRVPDDVMSPVSREFSEAFLFYTLERLKGIPI